MDGSEFTLDQTIIRSCTRSEGQLDMKEQKCSAEINEEMISHQESGDGRPTLEQGLPKAAVPDKGESDASLPIDHGVIDLRAGSKELVDQSQHRANIRNSPSQPNNPWTLDHESHWSSQPLASLKSQMASQIQHENEMEAKEDVTWISQRTGKLMKCKDQQTSRIWEYKPLAEILQHSVPKSQIQSQELMKGAQLSHSEEGIVSSKETVLPAKQKPCFSSQLPIEQELPCDLQPEEGPSHLQPQPLQDFQELHQPPEEKKPCDDNKQDSDQAFPRTSHFSQEQPTNITSVESHSTWINPKTQKQMICKSQQTSRIWECKPLSEILGPPIQDSKKSPERKRRTEGKSEAKVSFTEGTKSESLAVDKSHRSQSGLQLPAEEWDLTEQPVSSRASQMKLTKEEDVEEEITWICPQTGFLMKCKSQQTSSIWDGRRLSEILNKTNQATEMTEDYCGSMVDCVSRINREMTVSYTDEEEELQRTYSIISENEGIIFNRKTHKILTNRSQQTGEKTLWTHRESSEDLLEVNGIPFEQEQFGKQEIQGEGPQSLSLHNMPLNESPLGQMEALGGNEGENLEALSQPQLSEEMLFHIESSFVISQLEDDVPSIYEGEESGKEGSFFNTQTGKLLESQCLQTDPLSVQTPDAEAIAS